MKKVVLIIIYNHQFNENIAILEQIYNNRFSNIYHLVPFYNGEKSNVISVYDNSYYFQGYVAQGLKLFYEEDVTHYFFIADDLVLNPIINENNYMEYFKIDSEDCFLPRYINLHENTEWWPRVSEAFYWNMNIAGVEVKSQLPNYNEALKKFTEMGLVINPLCFEQIWKIPDSMKGKLKMMINDNRNWLRYVKSKFSGKKYSLSYPFVASYSDIFIVNADSIKQFCHYCGVFAATELFVEVALPTSLVLSAKKIITENNLMLKGKALWTVEEHKELEKYDYSLDQLLDNFPNVLYLHPIKLSKWKK